MRDLLQRSFQKRDFFLEWLTTLISDYLLGEAQASVVWIQQAYKYTGEMHASLRSTEEYNSHFIFVPV